jgi:hypothetical protein
MLEISKLILKFFHNVCYTMLVTRDFQVL